MTDLDDLDDVDLELHEREHICPTCNLVHWTPTGREFCDR